MRKAFLMSAALSFCAWNAQADVLQVPEQAAEETAAPAQLPAKGMSMAAVRQQFGEPSTQHPARGGGGRKHPPITRWDYNGFSVFFERKHVVDVVRPGAPAPVQNTQGLEKAEAPAEAAPAP